MITASSASQPAVTTHVCHSKHSCCCCSAAQNSFNPRAGSTPIIFEPNRTHYCFSPSIHLAEAAARGITQNQSRRSYLIAIIMCISPLYTIGVHEMMDNTGNFRTSAQFDSPFFHRYFFCFSYEKLRAMCGAAASRFVEV